MAKAKSDTAWKETRAQRGRDLVSEVAKRAAIVDHHVKAVAVAEGALKVARESLNAAKRDHCEAELNRDRFVPLGKYALDILKGAAKASDEGVPCFVVKTSRYVARGRTTDTREKKLAEDMIRLGFLENVPDNDAFSRGRRLHVRLTDAGRAKLKEKP